MEVNNSDEIRLLCQENRSRLKSLEQFLYQMISNSVKEFCFEYKAEKKNNPYPEDASRPKLFVSIQRPDEADIEDLAIAVVDERKQLGRKIKNHVTGEKVVCFDIPDDFEVEGIKNIEEIKDRLGKWRIQRRQRDSKMNDSYYCHLASRQTCRSIPEVLNFILYGHIRKRSDSDIASTSQGDETLSKMPSKKQRRDKNQNLEENCGPAANFANLEEAKQKLAHVALEGVSDEDDNFQHGVHFSKHDSVNYLLDYDWGPEEKFATLEEAKQKLANVELEGVTEDDDDHFHHGVHFSKHDSVNYLLDYDWGPAEKFATLEEAKQKLANVELEGVTEDDDDHFHHGVHFSKHDSVNYLLDYDWGPAEKFATLEEAKQKLAHVELEGVNDNDNHFQHGIHFSKPDPVNHLLDYDYDYYYDDVIHVLFRDWEEIMYTAYGKG